MRADLSGLLAAVALVSATGCHTLTGPSPVDANWRLHESAHFLLHVRPGSLADAQAGYFAAVLEDQYAFTLARLEARYDGRIAGFFYDSAADAGFSSSRTGVAYSFLTDAFKLDAGGPLDDGLLSVMTHEANHVIQRHALGQPGSSCMNEGMASAVQSERYLQRGPSFLHGWVGSWMSSVPSIAQLCDDDRWDGYDHQIKYNASASFIAWLIDTGGADRVRQLYRAPSADFVARFAAIYGRPLDEMDAEWRAFARARQ